jgi:hypothetical protein
VFHLETMPVAELDIFCDAAVNKSLAMFEVPVAGETETLWTARCLSAYSKPEGRAHTDHQLAEHMKKVLLVVLALLTAGSISGAQAFASADAAHSLVSLLDRVGLDAIATVDPQQPGTFVAALYIPRGQLLVVHARHPSVDGIRQRLAARQYREVYLDLQGTPTREGKFFVQDARADGILSALPGSGDVDVLYEEGRRQILFNGDINAQHLTSAEYDVKLAAADARYARLLTLLTAAVRDVQEQPAGSGE